MGGSVCFSDFWSLPPRLLSETSGRPLVVEGGAQLLPEGRGVCVPSDKVVFVSSLGALLTSGAEGSCSVF